MDLLAQMATFVSVVDGKEPLGGGARAAALSLPAVSRQLRALEDELGATLVARSTRRLQPPILAWALHRSELRGDPRVKVFLGAMSQVAVP